MAGRNDYFMRGVSRGKTSKADMGGGFLRRATRSGKSLYFVWLEEGSHGGVAGSSEIKFCSVWPAGRTSGFLKGLFNDTLPGAGLSHYRNCVDADLYESTKDNPAPSVPNCRLGGMRY